MRKPFGRTADIRAAIALVDAMERSRAGLSIEAVCEVLECTRRTAYRWLQALETVRPLERIYPNGRCRKGVRYRFFVRQ